VERILVFGVLVNCYFGALTFRLLGSRAYWLSGSLEFLVTLRVRVDGELVLRISRSLAQFGLQ